MVEGGVCFTNTFNGPLRGAVGIGYAVKVVYHSGSEKPSQGHLEATRYWGYIPPTPQDADQAELGQIGGGSGQGIAGSGFLMGVISFSNIRGANGGN
jgi:hypothetical protein